ncbi:hypothetical protein RB195_015680 [Necator americanus]|uniref:Uncharacterized protein n=1 Tax=Necator americanus TaxID=51031 RepID=A0ABR1E649_NECAM
MKRRRLVVLLVFNITSCVCISPDDWFCGFTNDHKLRLHKLFDGNCAQYRVPINFCCARHKDCYRLQLGKRHCDSRLCLCVEKYSENKDGCGPPIVRSCKDARMYGEKAYDAFSAAGTNETSTSEVELKQTHSELFDIIFDGCSETLFSAKACIVNFNECMKNMKASVCNKYVTECISCGARNSSKCMDAVDELREILGRKRTKDWSEHQKAMMWLTLVEIIISIISVGLAIIIPIKRRTPKKVTRKSAEKIKGSLEEIKQSTEDYYEKNYEKKHSAEVVEKSPDHPVFPYDAPPMPMEPWLPPTPTPDPWQPGSDDDYFSVTGSKEQDHRPDVNYKPYQSEPAYMGGSAEGFDRRGSAESHERRDSRETVAKPKIPKSVPKKFAHTKDKHGLFNRKKGKQKQAPKRRRRKIPR